MIYRALLILGTVLIILTPFFGLPGGIEDVLMQFLAAIVLVLILVSPRPVKKEPEIQESI